MIDGTVIRSRFEAMRPRLDERGRRLFCAAEARSVGYGGVSVVARATGIARSTQHHQPRPEGFEVARSRAVEASAPGRGTPGAHANRPYVAGRLARPAGVDD